ncbi:MAG: FeoB-associated Cys-rich membrane protein [Clostridia bacterium]|nr:FeoB-associated Cys-rich membrane protein [Clostridia bacterium]
MIPTIIAIVVILAIVLAIVIKMIINKKQGKTTCSCGCGGCAMKDMCHSSKSEDERALPNEQENGEAKTE